MENQFEIGSVLQFDQSKYTGTINYWNKHIIPGIKNIWAAYADLNIGAFNKEVFLLTVNNFPVFEKQFIVFLENERKTSNNALMAMLYSEDQMWNVAQARLVGIKAAVSKLNSALLSLSSVMLPISLEHCEITSDSIILDDAQIRAECTLAIQNQDQLDVWNAWTNVVAQYNAAVDLMVAKGFESNKSNILGSRGFIAEDNDCRLELLPDCLLQIPTPADFAAREHAYQLQHIQYDLRKKESEQVQVEAGQKVMSDYQLNRVFF